MSTAESTQGSKFSASKQDTFGTPQTTGFLDPRLEGEPSVGPVVGTPNIPDEIFTDPNKVSKAIITKEALDDAFTITSILRQPTTAGTNSWAKNLFEAGGYSVSDGGANTTIDTGPTLTAIPMVADNFVAGECMNIELDNGQYFVALVASVTASVATLAMGLPSAASAGNAINKCITVTPGNTGEVAADNLLTIKATVKAQDGGSDVVYIGQDCALTSLADLVLEPGSFITLEATFGATDLDYATGTLGTNAFQDSDQVTQFNDPYFMFADANAAGAIAYACANIMSLTWTWNITTEQIPGFGCTLSKNNVQSWMQKVEPNMLAITMLYDSNKLDEFTTSTNVSKFIGIVQPGSSALAPGCGLYLPNAHQVEQPQIDPWTENEHRIVVPYTGNPAGFGSTTTADAQGNQPFYFGVADTSS